MHTAVRRERTVVVIWLAWVLTVLALLFAVGTIAWQTPWIGFIGSLGGYIPGWLVVLSGAAAVSGVVSWIIQPSVAAVIAVVAAVLAGLVGVKVIRDQVVAVRALGVRPHAKDFFGPYSVSKSGPDEIVTYGPVAGSSPHMGVYLPQPSDGPAPVVIHVHGGGWSAGTESSDTAFVRTLTAAGYLVFTPTYTYASDSASTWDVAPAQLACAIAEVKSIAGRYGGSADSVYLTGSSAGGHLAALGANRLAAKDSSGRASSAMPAVAAVSLIIPAVDPAFAEGNTYVPAGAAGRKLVETFIGGSTQDHPHRYESVNATAALSEESPPALVVYGPNDWLVPKQGPLSYVLRARQLGVQVRATSIPWTGHLMGLSGAAGRVIAHETIEWFSGHPAFTDSDRVSARASVQRMRPPRSSHSKP